jgi:hypothetical protein
MSTVYDMNDCKEVVISKKYKVKGIQCDSCEREIPAIAMYDKKCKYFNVTTGHHDWGNDSCESREHFDICPDCIKQFTADYLEKCSGSMYIEIETEYATPYYESV